MKPNIKRHALNGQRQKRRKIEKENVKQNKKKDFDARIVRFIEMIKCCDEVVPQKLLWQQAGSYFFLAMFRTISKYFII